MLSSSEGEVEDDADPVTSRSGSAEPKKKRRKNPQVFVDSWLTDENFKKWLVRKMGVDNKATAFCKTCDKAVTCSKTGLKRHMASAKHERSITNTTTSGTIADLFQRASCQDETASLEIKLCSFIAEHNLPISLSDDLVELLRSLFPRDGILKRVMLGKQKATNVVRQVIGFNYLNEAISALRSHKFSFIIDETTDRSTTKQLAILATSFDLGDFRLKQYLIDMVEMVDGTAKSIYKAVKKTFTDFHIPMENIVGYSSDTTNVMFGEYNSVAQLIKSEYPKVVAVKCSCHLIHLASSYAALQLPKGLEDLCRNVFAHFNRSSKRQDVYKQFQQFYNVDPHRLLSPGQTRWLSLEACVNRILEQFVPLQNYFILAANEDPTHSNDRIVKSLHNKFNLAYLEFLSFQLERFNDFNRLFQSEKPLLHCLKDQVEELIRSTASDFMSITYVKATNPKDIDPANATFHVPLADVYLGVAATTTLGEIKATLREDDVDVRNFLINCRNFLIEGIRQVQQRFDLNDDMHEIVQCTSPARAAHRVLPSLIVIVRKLPSLEADLNVTKLDQEWREHVFEEKLNADMEWDQYWKIVKDMKVPSGDSKYPNLAKFVEIIASLPFSNAAVERVFSSVKRIKTEERNRLKSSSLVALLQCKFAMKNGNYNASSFPLNEHILDLMQKMKSSATDEEAISLRKICLDKLFGS
jgi:hypothetical protein